jgi:DNA-directed RNA polymerase I subunit RPA2
LSSLIDYLLISFLLFRGNMTPFSDYNQSPRNMYQCQMAKQSIGTPCHAFPYRADNKLFRLLTGQSPLVRPLLYERYISQVSGPRLPQEQDGLPRRRLRGTGFDAYPNGTNAVVAVIAYTGYDMEDAMILNKAAHERGFAMAYIYKTECVDLDGDIFKRHPATGKQCFLACFDEGTLQAGHLDFDGLPPIGTTLKHGQPLASIFDPVTQSHRFIRYKGFEDALLEHVLLLASDEDTAALGARKVHLQLRIPRAPVIGDKFASRHGQKGVCSQRYPAVDLPFSSESGGLTPDIIINPNAFPSRMTIGMFIESMAGKAAALHAIPQDATPWKYLPDSQEALLRDSDSNRDIRETDANKALSDLDAKLAQSPSRFKLCSKTGPDSSSTAYGYFGEQLKAAGYNYYGNETMYSGITGRPLKTDIYLGIVYYQRLRHMGKPLSNFLGCALLWQRFHIAVLLALLLLLFFFLVNDKFQVRTTGPIHNLTHQPIKGRKRAGGIRFGEMERDALLAHGTAFLLHDRLMNCSDYTHMYACTSCGSILSILTLKEASWRPPRAQQMRVKSSSGGHPEAIRGTVGCLTCAPPTKVVVLALPYVYKYLATELLSMNIRLTLDIQ